MSSSSSPDGNLASNKKNNTGAIVGGVIAGVVGLMILIPVIATLCRRRRLRSEGSYTTVGEGDMSERSRLGVMGIEAGRYGAGELGRDINDGSDRTDYRPAYGRLSFDVDGSEDAAGSLEAAVARAGRGGAEDEERRELAANRESDDEEDSDTPTATPTTSNSNRWKVHTDSESSSELLNPFRNRGMTPPPVVSTSGITSGEGSYDPHSSFLPQDSSLAAAAGTASHLPDPLTEVQAPTTEGYSSNHMRSDSLLDLYRPDSMVLRHRENEDADGEDDDSEWDADADEDEETDASPLVLNRPPPFPLNAPPSPLFSAGRTQE